MPLLKSGKKEGQTLLEVDIAVLADIVNLLSSCYQRLGRTDEFAMVLDHVEHFITDKRWQDKVAYLRSLWWMNTKSDRSKARDCISHLEIANCEDIDILTLYLDVNGEELSFDQKDELFRRIIAGTDEDDIRFQYECALGIARIAICETDEAIRLIEVAIDQFRSTEEDERSLYGKHLFARALQQLGILKHDDDLIRESAKAYSTLLECADECNLSDFAIADYLSEVGKCHDLLGDQIKAIDCFDKSAERYSIPLTQVYLASAYINKGDNESARKVLQAINADELSDVNRQDFALACSTLAAKTCNREDIDIAVAELKCVSPREPYFLNMKNECLVALLETKPSVQQSKLRDLLQKINRYLMLQPNFFGVGVNINNMLDDVDREDE
ncbi:MAG: hypothetical protein GXP28_06635 [Planctomycetes bacterium]|nr:hypothetical protein [Planctomycetota bacterium]